MPRPRKCRKVCCLPKRNIFQPINDDGERLDTIVMAVDELETIRLIDKEGFSQEECGAYMNVARTTVQQIYTTARKKLADAIIDGCILKIEGGDYQLCNGEEDYCDCGGCRKHRLCRLARQLKENHIMKIMLPLDEDKLSICPVFARAPFFMVYDGDSKETTCMPNPATNEQGGAGIKAAQIVVDNGATILITPRCGENAAEIFKEADVKIYKSQGTDAAANIAAFLDGKLQLLDHFHAGYHGIK